MDTSTAGAAWRAVTGADVSVMDQCELSTWFERLNEVRNACDAIEVMAVRRQRELTGTNAGISAETIIAASTNRSGRDARAVAQRAAACAAIPAFESALAAGQMSAGHVDAAATALQRLDGDVAAQFADMAPELVGRADQLGIDAFGKECRDLARHLRNVADQQAEVDELERQRAQSTVKRWIDRDTGMHHTLLSLDPLRDSIIWKAINAELATTRQQPQSDDLTWNQLQAGAMVAAIVSRSDTATGRTVPEVGVLIDWSTLVSDATVGGICETVDGVPLPVATVRRLCCDADIFPVVLGGQGEVLDQGRALRTANRAQRRALAAMHRGCAFPGCTVGFDASRMHHVRWWWQHRGPTDIDNLLPLCERHHHLVHEGGWTLTMTAERVATWVRADGTQHHRGPTVDRQPSIDSAGRTPMLC